MGGQRRRFVYIFEFCRSEPRLVSCFVPRGVYRTNKRTVLPWHRRAPRLAGWLTGSVGRVDCYRTRARAPPADDRLTGLAVPRERNTRAPHTRTNTYAAHKSVHGPTLQVRWPPVYRYEWRYGPATTRRETNENARRGDSISHRAAVEANYPVQSWSCNPTVRGGVGGRALCGSPPPPIAHPSACYTGEGHIPHRPDHWPTRGAVVGVAPLPHKFNSPSPRSYMLFARPTCSEGCRKTVTFSTFIGFDKKKCTIWVLIEYK